MAVLTISRQFGAGGWTLAERLSKRLGYRCINEDVIREAARKMNVSSGQVQAFEKAGATKLMKFLDKIVSPNFIDRHITEKYGYVDEKKYIDAIKLIVQELYASGNIIIIGRGSQFILKDKKDVRHILLVQNLESRIRFMMSKYNMSEEEAKKAIKSRDDARNRFLSFFSETGYQDDPTSYDLVINMDRVSMDIAQELAVALISGVKP